MKVFYMILLIWNILIFIIYGLDKLFAKKKMRRISERTLLLLPFFMGGAGAMFGMVIFNHKTSKPRFRVWVPAEVVLMGVLIYLIQTYLL